MPGMSQQNESPTTKPGNDCPLCRKGTLVPSPSGINLLCRACKKITVLPLGVGGFLAGTKSDFRTEKPPSPTAAHLPNAIGCALAAKSTQ